MTHGSLFAGIGGFDLGFERAGIKTVWQVEIDPFCRKVLERHWPNVQRFEDVRTVGAVNLPYVDVICGGFPCQDVSNCGTKSGLDGERSGLWSEMHRIIGELRPRFVVVENVAALLQRGIDRVLGDLADIRYDAEWMRFDAQAFGAPHLRPRIFIVAYSDSLGLEKGAAYSVLCQPPANARHDGHVGSGCGARVWQTAMPPKSTFCGVADGLPDRLDRLSAIGNAVVPQIAEWIGRRILACEGQIETPPASTE